MKQRMRVGMGFMALWYVVRLCPRIGFAAIYAGAAIYSYLHPHHPDDIVEVISELPRDEFRALYLFKFENRSHEEIAQIMGITPDRAIELISMARVRVKRALEEREKLRDPWLPFFEWLETALAASLVICIVWIAGWSFNVW